MSRYQKCKTSLDFTEARDSEWQWYQLGLMQVCTLLQTDNHTSTPPLFLQAGCPSCRPTNSVEALEAPHEGRDLVQNWPLETDVFAQRYALVAVYDATVGLVCDWVVLVWSGDYDAMLSVRRRCVLTWRCVTSSAAVAF